MVKWNTPIKKRNWERKMNNKLFILAFVIVLIVLLSACTLGKERITLTGSGNLVTREESLSGFDRVDASHSFQVQVSQGDTYRVVIRVDDNIAQYLKVEKSGSTLKIGLDSDYNYDLKRVTLKAEVTMSELTGLELSGASRANITGFASSKAFDVDLSGSSAVRGDIEAGDASFELSGSSDVNLTGSAGDVRIDASGSSDIDLSDFFTVDAKVEVSGSSEATVKPSGRLDADASGSSHIYYLGNPTLGKIDASGSSSVERK